MLHSLTTPHSDSHCHSHCDCDHTPFPSFFPYPGETTKYPRWSTAGFTVVVVVVVVVVSVVVVVVVMVVVVVALLEFEWLDPLPDAAPKGKQGDSRRNGVSARVRVCVRGREG